MTMSMIIIEYVLWLGYGMPAQSSFVSVLRPEVPDERFPGAH